MKLKYVDNIKILDTAGINKSVSSSAGQNSVNRNEEEKTF